MRKTHRKSISVVSLYVISLDLLYINFNFDFPNLHNVFFENYFANELARSIVRSFAVRVLSDIKILDFFSYLYI
jgi:hypothetical protein